MMMGSKQLVWAFVACATVVAQIMSQGVCRAGDHPCCTAERCPLCAAEGVHRTLERPEQPCDCQLTARDEQPLALSRGSLSAVSTGDAAFAPGVPALLVPQVLGVSREYLAASLTVPIRPPRILFGVWRN